MLQRKSRNCDPWLDAFQRALAVKEKRPEGPGWLTMKQVMKRLGWGESKTHKWLKEEQSAGRMEKFRGSAMGGGGKTAFNTTWYRPKQAAPFRA